MNLSGVIILLVVASLIGRIVKSAQQSQAKRNKQNPSVPYRENQPQATAAHEAAAKPGSWKGADSFRQMLERLEEAAKEEQKRKDPAVNFSQAFEGFKPIPRTVAPQGKGMASGEGTISTQGMASAEGTYSTQGLASAEGTFSTQGLASAEGTFSTQGLASATEGGPASPRAAQARASAPTLDSRTPRRSFADVGELRRAVVMSEVLAKPVSLRRRRAV